MIDLRSDTVTQPTAEMRAVMTEAPVGDDVYGDDPSVNALQQEAADLLGKECALFVASGTQANLLALLSHCDRGDEYIAGEKAHLYRFEAGGAAVLGSVQPQPVPMAEDGRLDLDAVRAAIKPDDPHFARSRVLCLENTHAGRVQPLSYFDQARALCDEADLGLHLDGARLCNAAVATGETPRAFASRCDSVSLCLSKGLGAPVGSVLAGTRAFITRAHRLRKMLGGGMRQAGILAAAGSYALAHHVARLAEDHAHARQVADALNALRPGVAKNATSMLFLDSAKVDVDALKAFLQDRGIKIRGTRWVFHLGIDETAVDRLLRGCSEFFAACAVPGECYRR